jgi:transmembrane sensor
VSVPFEDRVTEARLSRQWRNVRDGLEKKRPRRWPVVLAAAITVGAIVAIAFAVWPRPSPAAWSGTAVETQATEQQIELADGTRVVVEPESRLSVCAEAGVCLVVDRGRARFDVTKDQDRVFRVRAGDVEVRVVGTRFTVTHRVETGRAETVVEVNEGVVEVRAGGGDPRRVSAGQRFAMTFGENEPPPEPNAVEEPVEPEPAVRRPTEPPSQEEADALFEEARAARAGDPALAAQRYGEFVRRFPRDPRAGLAAFELGRIRMDSLGDPAGAVAPLGRALRSSGGAFREDALARLVRVHARLGNTDRCTELRERYLRLYPSGAYRAAVAGLCP